MFTGLFIFLSPRLQSLSLRKAQGRLLAQSNGPDFRRGGRLKSVFLDLPAGSDEKDGISFIILRLLLSTRTLFQ